MRETNFLSQLKRSAEGLHEVKWTQAPSLADATMHEVADRLAAMKSVDSGVAYARGMHVEKSTARRAVRGLFTRQMWPKSLSILTMPGLDWTFEDALLRSREGNFYDHRGERGPRRTFITAIERTEAIYRAAVKKMPGLLNGLKQKESPPYATASLKTPQIMRFHRCEFERLADHYVKHREHGFDAAWLDFTGPLTNDLMDLMTVFFHAAIRWRLVVTSLAARWPAGTRDAFRWHPYPANRLWTMTYADNSPMVQVAFEHKEGR